MEEGPKVLAHPLQLKWLKQISHLLWQITPWVDTIGATVAIFEFPPRTPPNSQNWRKNCSIFLGGSKGDLVESKGVLGGNSKIATVAPIVSTQGVICHSKWEIYFSHISCRGCAKTLGPSSALIRVPSVEIWFLMLSDVDCLIKPFAYWHTQMLSLVAC